MDKVAGIKTIQIHAKTTYPIISAYEFEFLKSDEEVQALLRRCTIYFIIQRPLIYFNNFRSQDGVITFDLVDDTESKPLHIKFIPSDNGFCSASEEIFIKLMFYKKDPDLTEPFNDVAAFNLLSLDEKFLVWFSPQKFVYEYLSGNIVAEVEGNLTDYIDYRVHYIGKSFAQKIWKRLTGHHKMQKILTLEDSLNKKSLKAPFEIALLMLDIDGFDEGYLFPYEGFGLSDNCDPILHEVSLEDDDDDSLERFLEPNLSPNSPELTSEVEAMLVNQFKPEYNDILFENYPCIQKGTRLAGYSESALTIKKIPAILKTNFHTQGVILPSHA